MNSQYQTQDLKLGIGRYTMTVMNVREAVKRFQGRNGMTTRHDIFFQDNDGFEYRGELLTQSVTQRDFMVGEICCFEVVNAAMNEIIKCKDDSLLIAKPDEPASEELHGVLVAGTSHALALSFAKDLAASRIRMGHITGEEKTFMEDILRNAWMMNKWLLDPQEPLPF